MFVWFFFQHIHLCIFSLNNIYFNNYDTLVYTNISYTALGFGRNLNIAYLFHIPDIYVYFSENTASDSIVHVHVSKTNPDSLKRNVCPRHSDKS